jgi:hypothetical protein
MSSVGQTIAFLNVQNVENALERVFDIMKDLFIDITCRILILSEGILLVLTAIRLFKPSLKRHNPRLFYRFSGCRK